MSNNAKVKSNMDSTIQDRPRDNEGQFISAEKEKEHLKKDPISRLFSENIHYERNKDDLLDIHVGNPLRKIVDLLQEIKNQKAFSFTLKGSLGIAGVFLALSVFGILGGGKMLCDKGTQSKIGVIKILAVQERESYTSIPILSQIIDFFAVKPVHPRTLIVDQNEISANIPFSANVNFLQYKNIKVITTGNYDSCSQTLKVTDPTAIEPI